MHSATSQAHLPRGAHHRRSSLLVVLGTAASLAAGCDHADLIERLGDVRIWGGQGAGEPASTKIPFVVFRDDVGARAAAERRVLFKTKDAYQGFFGHAPPASVRFPDEWVIFYAAGTKPSGGFGASVQDLSIVPVGQEKLLVAVTRLESPGNGCVVTDAITTPHVLVKFAAQTALFNVDFAKDDVRTNCSGVPTNPCAATLCPVGTRCEIAKSNPPQAVCIPIEVDVCATVRCRDGHHCEAQQVQCVRAPCPPVAACVPNATTPRCGGFAGTACPGKGSCHDDPSDTCDPNNGGADCGGLCACTVRLGCADGQMFNTSPDVCACVPARR